MFDLLNRIRRVDPRKFTPTQWVMVAVGVIVALWVLSTLLSIATTIMPFVVLGILFYVGYRALSSRSEEAAKVQQQKREAAVSQADASADRAQEQVEAVRARRLVEPTIDPKTGLETVDIARLEEQERRLMQQAKQADADEVQRQLEERRKRLLGNQSSE
ncbi:hypothetical protein VZO05_15495 [Aggregatilineales bacterium SYSU G02658]